MVPAGAATSQDRQTWPEGRGHAPSWEREIIKADILPIEKKRDKPGLSDPGQTVALASDAGVTCVVVPGGEPGVGTVLAACSAGSFLACF